MRLQRPGEFQSPSSAWGSGEPSQPVHPGPEIQRGGPSTFETVGQGHGGCHAVHNLLKFLAVDLGEPMTVDTKVIWEYLDKAIKVDGAVLRPTAVDWSALRVRAGSMTRRSMFLL